MSSVIPALAPALVTRWAALPALVAVNAEVRRGAPVGGIDLDRLVAVEFDGAPEARENARFVQDWIDMACTRRRETGELMCTALAQTGDDDVDVMEQSAFALFAACAADLQSDLTVGGLVWSQHVVAGSAQQLQNERGVAVLVPFTVAYAASVV